jgi:hypothetical protein
MEDLTIEEMTSLKGGTESVPDLASFSQSINKSPATAANLNFNIGGLANYVSADQDASAKVFNIAKYVTQIL